MYKRQEAVFSNTTQGYFQDVMERILIPCAIMYSVLNIGFQFEVKDQNPKVQMISASFNKNVPMSDCDLSLL